MVKKTKRTKPSTTKSKKSKKSKVKEAPTKSKKSKDTASTRDPDTFSLTSFQLKLEKLHQKGDHDEYPHPRCASCKAQGKKSKKPVSKERAPRVSSKPSKKSSSKYTGPITPDIIDRWKDGAHLPTLANEVGMKRNKFRRELTKALGGKDAYNAARASGAGGKREFGRPRNADGEVVTAKMDDSKVKKIHRTRVSDGWKVETTYVNAGGKPLNDSKVGYLPLVSTPIFVAPDGTKYVRAQGNEKADLIFVPKGTRGHGLDPVRLRKYEESSIGKKVKKEEKLVKRGVEKLAKEREVKAEKRKARKEKKEKAKATTMTRKGGIGKRSRSKKAA